MIPCTNCAAAMPPGTNFCTNCGTALRPLGATTTMVTAAAVWPSGKGAGSPTSEAHVATPTCGTTPPWEQPSDAPLSGDGADPAATGTQVDAPVGPAVVTTAAAWPESAQAAVGVVRRPRSAGAYLPWTPPQTSQHEVVVSRNVLSRSRSGRGETSRERIVAGDLPDWEPLPPGELLVRRGTTR